MAKRLETKVQVQTRKKIKGHRQLQVKHDEKQVRERQEEGAIGRKTDELTTSEERKQA